MLSFTTNGNFIDFKYTEDQYPFYVHQLTKLHNTSKCITWGYSDDTTRISFTIDDETYDKIPITSIYFDGVVMSAQADFKTNIESMFPGLAGSSSSILVATKTIEDDDIKTLPTTQVEIVAAPGSGKMIIPISVSIVTNFITTGYTNLAADIRIGIPMQSSNVLNTSSWMVFDADAFGVFDPQGTKWLYNPPINYDGVSAAENLPNDDTVNLDNVALKLKVINGANGNFTGGDISNNMKITISYMIVDL